MTTYHERTYGYGYDESDEDEEENGPSGATHTLREVVHEFFQLKPRMNLDGYPIARDISIKEEDIISHETFSRESKKEDFRDPRSHETCPSFFRPARAAR